MLRLRRLAALAAMLALAALAPAQQKKERPLDVVNYEELGKLVRAEKGKVVVVYIWSYG
jgi:hypothetical protein